MPAGDLIRQIEALGAPYGLERSVKIMPGHLADDRCLISIGRDALGHAPIERLLRIGRECRMPDKFADALPAAFQNADIVHFGYEAAAGQEVYKVYCEYAAQARAAIAAKTATPVTVYLAYKWDKARPEHGAITRYDWIPVQTRADLESKLQSLLPESDAPRARRCALDLASRVATAADAGQLFLMEVEEAGNPRRSCDLNVYNAGLRLGDIADLLNACLRDFGVAAERSQPIFAPAASKALGHLSAGVGRNGQEFVTVYFGVEGH